MLGSLTWLSVEQVAAVSPAAMIFGNICTDSGHLSFFCTGLISFRSKLVTSFCGSVLLQFGPGRTSWEIGCCIRGNVWGTSPSLFIVSSSFHGWPLCRLRQVARLSGAGTKPAKSSMAAWRGPPCTSTRCAARGVCLLVLSFAHSNISSFHPPVHDHHFNPPLPFLSIFAARYPPYELSCMSKHSEGAGICILFSQTVDQRYSVPMCQLSKQMSGNSNVERHLKSKCKTYVCWFQKSQDPARSLAELRAKGRALLAATFPKAPVNWDSDLR